MANEMVRKQFITKIEETNEENRTITFVLSTENVDRDGDVIRADGWILDNYLKNPVVLFAHKYDSLPVARAEKVWVENGSLKATAKFATEKENPLAENVYQLYKNGYMNAVSVGFIPIEYEEKGEGYEYSKQELLEFSCVPVPANPEALISLAVKGMKKEKEVVGIETPITYNIVNPTNIEALNSVSKRSMTISAEELLKYENETKEAKGVITYRQAHPDGTPKAPEDEAWDAAAEVREADVDDLRVMCAWVDSENSDLKTAYKLPHHKASDNHSVVWRGVAAAMAALFGARGGVDIPENDRRGVYNHLARHYEEFEREVPEFRSYNVDDDIELLSLLKSCYEPEKLTDEQNNEIKESANKDEIDSEEKEEMSEDEIRKLIKSEVAKLYANKK